MAMVVTEPCKNCKDKSCTVVCPMECFYDAGDMLVINPEECIDCEACIPQCPVEAIYYQDDVPEIWSSYIELNKKLAAISPPAG